MTKKSFAKLAAYGLGGSAVAGVGFAAGRDAWKSFKKNPWPLLFVFAVFGFIAFPYMAGRDFIRGHNRGFLGTLFKTLLGNMLLFVFGTLCGLVVVGAFYGLTMRAPEITADMVNAATGQTATALSMIGAGIGFVVGLIERPGRKKISRTAKLNELFMEKAGIVETGGKTVTHRDRVGHDLRLLDVQNDRLDFMVVGRRNQRAYIYLDDDGRMVEYSGAVKRGTSGRPRKNIVKHRPARRQKTRAPNSAMNFVSSHNSDNSESLGSSNRTGDEMDNHQRAKRKSKPDRKTGRGIMGNRRRIRPKG